MTISEKLAKKILIEKGYQVEYAIKTQWHRNDLFNLWDFICVNQEEVLFIQVSTKKNGLYGGSHHGKDFIGFPCPPNCRKEFWAYDMKTKEFAIRPI